MNSPTLTTEKQYAVPLAFLLPEAQSTTPQMLAAKTELVRTVLAPTVVVYLPLTWTPAMETLSMLCSWTGTNSLQIAPSRTCPKISLVAVVNGPPLVDVFSRLKLVPATCRVLYE